MEKGGAPRQGLGNDLSQLQLVRAGEHKLPGTIPFVDDRLQVAEQMWGSLDLVKDNFTSVRFKESAGSSVAKARRSGSSSETYLK